MRENFAFDIYYKRRNYDHLYFGFAVHQTVMNRKSR